ncbi:6-hydroxy-D-nicotine oxidase [Diplogelasinospora grovesii]|uniref:6-hydroxy-D-nicotine oxidase n=1 Tax=Diplogelasinospora grovesii TaxID=303347 RepID=A0AAN6N603_9PEZI|nr:6-hydroxy-D-nicotine oxidase [Diplogelasinospora grovesii]
MHLLLALTSVTVLVGGCFSSAASIKGGGNFTWETVQLTTREIGNFTALRFGNPYFASDVDDDGPECRAFPGSSDWPEESEWKQLNVSLGGGAPALLRPVPPGAACYPTDSTHYNPATCRFLVRQAGLTHFWIDDPLSVLTQWPQGGTCMATLNVAGNCTRGGYPEYVVNATTVKHIQAAVNFARNKNVRVIIKNTGHDFGGRSTGFGSLSIWVHNLKSFEFLPEYEQGDYSGMAVRVGAGMEAWELFNHMADHNITVIAPGGSTVGAVGGWMAAGGHGPLSSKFGLGSDQALSINVVTADGRFVTADTENNEDLFYALRGGGPSTYGVMTSVIMKAYPPINLTTVPLSLSVNTPPMPTFNFTLPTNGTIPGTNTSWTNFTLPPISPGTRTPGMLSDAETFWKGVRVAYKFTPKVLAVGGYTYSYIYPLGNNSFTFTSTASVPGMPASEVSKLMQPMFDDLHKVGINMTNPKLPENAGGAYAGRRMNGGGDQPVNTRYRSRLWPRTNWENDGLFNRSMAAIRTAIEKGGYTFHAIGYGPSEEVAGYPVTDVGSGLNPAWRNAVLHASLMEVQPTGITAAEAKERDARVLKYTDVFRQLTPGAGAYMNEGDPAEPNWQQAFFGEDNYDTLLGIKQDRDPWGLFWAQTTVGSEAWEVRTLDGYPCSQNGRLCKVKGWEWDRKRSTLE